MIKIIFFIIRYVFLNIRDIIININYALQIQAKDVEHILQDVVNHSSAVRRIEDASSDLINLPQEAIEDTEKEDVRTHTGMINFEYVLHSNTLAKSLPHE